MAVTILQSRIRSWTTGKAGVVELGCGDARWAVYCSTPLYVGIDIDPPPVDVTCPSKARTIRAEVTDVPSWLPEAKGCDVAMLIDFIEHLPKPHGIKLLEEIEQHFSRVLIFTPLGWMPMNHGEGHAQTHKSAWLACDLASRGYLVEVWPVYHTPHDGEPTGALWASKECAV